MVSQKPEYELSAEENTFLRTAVLEFMTIQIFREYIHNIKDESLAKEKLNALRNEALAFSKELNDEGSPQDLAWDKAMTRMFSRIFETIAAPYNKTEG